VAADFLDGLVEMATAAGETIDLPEFKKRFKLPVFCVSSMDFQKLTGLREADVDGNPGAWGPCPSTKSSRLVYDPTKRPRVRPRCAPSSALLCTLSRAPPFVACAHQFGATFSIF
jgi:hypothetical protein